MRPFFLQAFLSFCAFGLTEPLRSVAGRKLLKRYQLGSSWTYAKQWFHLSQVKVRNHSPWEKLSSFSAAYINEPLYWKSRLDVG